MNEPAKSAKHIVLEQMEHALKKVDGDYSRLAWPEDEDWKNIFLAAPELDELRHQAVSWKNGKIEQLLGDHFKLMKAAGVTLTESTNGFIMFHRIAQD